MQLGLLCKGIYGSHWIQHPHCTTDGLIFSSWIFEYCFGSKFHVKTSFYTKQTDSIVCTQFTVPLGDSFIKNWYRHSRYDFMKLFHSETLIYSDRFLNSLKKKIGDHKWSTCSGVFTNIGPITREIATLFRYLLSIHNVPIDTNIFFVNFCFLNFFLSFCMKKEMTDRTSHLAGYSVDTVILSICYTKQYHHGFNK